jgi:single-stranded DNA-binding protein
VAAVPADRAAERRPRLTLSGRVGANPTVRTTPTGTRIARFPLAVREQATTTWHQILAFNARAEQVQASVSKGDAVEVIGYPHEREQRRRDGSVRTVEEVYAVVIKQQSRER